MGGTAGEPDRIIGAKELRSMIPYSPMHIWRLERAGQFPRRIRLGPNRVGWSLIEVTGWMEAKKSRRVARSKRPEAFCCTPHSHRPFASGQTRTR
jgi:prophage regulatory protein